MFLFKAARKITLTNIIQGVLCFVTNTKIFLSHKCKSKRIDTIQVRRIVFNEMLLHD